MKICQLVKSFVRDEDGAVTVDWVVLTAAVVGLGIAVLTSVRTGTATVTSAISTQLSGTTITSTFP
ncbi:MAG: Flp family type IVb pilin [Tranquillimonas sp.]|jgi:Flp pilus assembly pilin Flp